MNHRKVYTQDRLPTKDGEYFVRTKSGELDVCLFDPEWSKDYWPKTVEWWLEPVMPGKTAEEFIDLHYPDTHILADGWGDIKFYSEGKVIEMLEQFAKKQESTPTCSHCGGEYEIETAQYCKDINCIGHQRGG